MDNNSIDKYIQRLDQLQKLYKKGEGQHNAFGIAINEAKEMLVSKNESLHLVSSSFNVEEVEKAIKQYKKEQLPDAETPYHFDAEIWSGMKSFLRWIESKSNDC
jgi:hypothetical protein